MNVSGVAPVINESDFFVLDKSGSFSLGDSVWATIYLIGGGSDGSDGYYDRNKQIVHGGNGGDAVMFTNSAKLFFLKILRMMLQLLLPMTKAVLRFLYGGKNTPAQIWADNSVKAVQGV